MYYVPGPAPTPRRFPRDRGNACSLLHACTLYTRRGLSALMPTLGAPLLACRLDPWRARNQSVIQSLHDVVVALAVAVAVAKAVAVAVVVVVVLVVVVVVVVVVVGRRS